MKIIIHTKLLIFLILFFYSLEIEAKPKITVTKLEDKQATFNWSDNYGSAKIIVLRLKSEKLYPPAEGKKYHSAPMADTKEKESITGTGNVVVYQGAENSGKLSLINLLPDSDYILDFYYINKAGKTENKDKPHSINIYTLAKKPDMQAASIIYMSTTSNSLEIKYGRGNGENSIIIVRESKVPDNPRNGIVYRPDNQFGKGQTTGEGSYVVYSGKDNQITLKNLKPNTKYFIKVADYNGHGGKIHYLSDDIGGNPSSKTTLLSTPVIEKAFNVHLKGFMPKWKKVQGAETYLLDIASDKGFINYLKGFKNLDVGNIDDYEVDNLPAGKKFYYRVSAKSTNNYSQESEIIEVQLPQ